MGGCVCVGGCGCVRVCVWMQWWLFIKPFHVSLANLKQTFRRHTSKHKQTHTHTHTIKPTKEHRNKYTETNKHCLIWLEPFCKLECFEAKRLTYTPWVVGSLWIAPLFCHPRWLGAENEVNFHTHSHWSVKTWQLAREELIGWRPLGVQITS